MPVNFSDLPEFDRSSFMHYKIYVSVKFEFQLLKFHCKNEISEFLTMCL